MKGGVITLQDILDVLSGQGEIQLLILSDCCYSGTWATNLKNGYGDEGKGKPYHSTGDHNVYLRFYSSCSYTEIATEMVFANHLEGHVPDLAGGGDF